MTEEQWQQLQEENAALRAENQELHQRVADLETRLKQIEERLSKGLIVKVRGISPLFISVHTGRASLTGEKVRKA